MHKAAWPFRSCPTLPAIVPVSASEEDRWHPERETLELAAAGAAKVLGAAQSATRALARASITMAKVDLWHARLALKCLRRDQREAIAEAAEG